MAPITMILLDNLYSLPYEPYSLSSKVEKKNCQSAQHFLYIMTMPIRISQQY